jgi:hypothetical protein
MRFALADVPKIYTGQEVSAQDVNNLIQNTEILEQIAYGPDKLFLSSWRMAPPVFRLHYNSGKAYQKPNTVGFFSEIDLKEVTVWEGSFLYREGMYKLRVGFQTQALIEEGPNYFTSPVDLNQFTAADGLVNKSVSLFMIIKYTGIPIKELIETPRYQKFVKSWVYDTTKVSTYKQPGTDVNSFIFSGADVTTTTYSWKPVGKTLDGYHEFELDINDFGLTPGEIVQVSFKLATRDFKSVVAGSPGRTFYFSPVYAHIEHNYFKEQWTSIASITSLNQLPDLAKNQRILVDYFKTTDNPLRASVWDQVLVGSSYFSFFSKWTDDVKSLLVNWGLIEDLDFLLLNHYSQQARYYVQRNWHTNNAINLSYAVTVNSMTAFTLQGILSATPTVARHYRYSVKLNPESSSIPQFIVAEPEDWINWPAVSGSFPPRSRQYADLLLKSPFRYLGNTNYTASSTKPANFYFLSGNFSLDNLTARRGYFRFIGQYTDKHAGDDPQTYRTPMYDSSIAYRGNISGVTLDSGDFIFYRKKLRYGNESSGSVSFGGFYFIRPSPAGDGGIPYYGSTSQVPLGTSFDFFLGPIVNTPLNTRAYQYVDSFNFNLTNEGHTGANVNKYYPAIFDKHFTNVVNHGKFFVTHNANAYTDFSVDLHEASPNWSNSKGSMQYAGYNESYAKRMFNKASYISTIRIAEVSARNSGFSVASSAKFNSFDSVSFSDLKEKLNYVNTKINEVYQRTFGASAVHSLKYTPLFWMKPKSMLHHYESYLVPENKSADRLWQEMEANTVYFSQTRQADYLVVRGKNVRIGWNGFTKVFRDNPKNHFMPAPLEVEFAQSQNLTGQDIETVIISLASLKGLTYGQRYFIQGEVYYAAETMGVP